MTFHCKTFSEFWMNFLDKHITINETIELPPALAGGI